MWKVDDISFEMVHDMTDAPVVTLLVETPAGRLRFLGEPVVIDRVLVCRSTHVQDASPNTVGSANLILLAQALMERMGWDGIVIEGAIRTTGANPGHRPRLFRFTRQLRPPAA